MDSKQRVPIRRPLSPLTLGAGSNPLLESHALDEKPSLMKGVNLSCHLWNAVPGASTKAVLCVKVDALIASKPLAPGAKAAFAAAWARSPVDRGRPDRVKPRRQRSGSPVK